MVDKIPEWDDELGGHAAVVLNRTNRAVCHAVKTQDMPTDESLNETTCGRSLSREDTKNLHPRKTLEGNHEYDELCQECWPEEIRQ